MSLPKVEFEILEPKEYIDFFIYSAYEIPYFKERVHNRWPIFTELKSLPEKEKKTKLINYFNKKLIEEKEFFIQQKQLFQKNWNKINDEMMQIFEKVLETTWYIKKIKARLTYNPICPRNIHKHTFDIYYKYDTREIIKTTIHESLHYIWFKKWSEVFPNHNKEEFDSPHKIWKLSEFVVVIILNKPEFANLIKKHFDIPTKFDTYITYKNGEIKTQEAENLLKQELEEIYKNRESMEDFMKKSYEFIIENDIFTEN
ncbi:MAG: hypothetical protein ACOC3Z_00050 [Nanoarchaeota archaeon]